MPISESRKTNSIRNMIYAVATYVVTVLFAFIERRVFVDSLSTVYLGINGVMTNVLSILAITELGFGEAIMFSLYKPIRENNNNKIAALLQLYKKTYIIISIVMVILSIVVLPFLPSLIKDSTINRFDIYIAFLLFLISTISSYFGAHRRSIIIAYQKRYIVSAAHGVCRVLMYTIQIVILLTTHNYYVYLIIMVISSLTESIALFFIAGKKYPVVNNTSFEEIPGTEKREIYKNIAAMAMHKIGGTLVTSTDNILISKLVGVVEVGLFSNYILIRTTIYTVTHSLFKSLIASMGDLGNDHKEYAESVFNKILYASGWLFGWCSICLLCLYDDFITLWLGKAFLLDGFTVKLIVLSFYLTCMREPVIMARDAFGLFWKDRWKAIIEAIINLIVSIVLAHFLGLPGIVIGTIISTLLTCFWIEPYVLYKYGFDKGTTSYYVKYLVCFLASFISFIPTYYLCNQILSNNIFTFAFKMVICIILPNLIFILFTCKTEEFKYFYLGLHNRVIKKEG